MLDNLLQQLWLVKNEKRKLAEKLKILNANEEYLEKNIALSMRAEGLEKVTSKAWGSATLKSEFYPTIDDWGSFTLWLLSSKDFSLLSKEIRKAVWRECYKDLGTEIPGIGSFERDVIRFRSGKGDSSQPQD